MIPVYKPYLNKEILKHAHEALDSTWLSSGKYIDDIEAHLTMLHSGCAAITCCNGTAATHLVARLLKKAHPRIKKIFVPNNVYVAAWNAFLYDDNFELVPIDADEHTWNFNTSILYEKLSKQDLEETAVLAVHNLGNIVNVPELQRHWRGLIVVEDNCEGFFGRYENQRSGTASLASSLSFFGNKNITCGEGGAVITQNHGPTIQKMKSQGQSHTKFIHDELGYNYRMTNIQAAILKGQLEHYLEIYEMKTKLFETYKELLSNIEGVSYQKPEKNTSHSLWMFGIRINSSKYEESERIFNEKQIEVRPMFYPMYRHKHLGYLRDCGNFNIADLLNKECIILPSYPELTEGEISHIVDAVKYVAENVKKL